MGDAGKILGWVLTGGVGLWLLQQGKVYLDTRRKRKTQRDRYISFLCGLPDDMKAVLVEFQIKGAHTLAVDDWADPVRQLIREKALIQGEPIGPYRTARYLTVKSELWEIIQGEWLFADPAAALIAEHLRFRKDGAEDAVE